MSNPDLHPVVETLARGHHWLRLTDPGWSDPLDPEYAREHGGRWNPPGSHPTLYLNADLDTARAQVVRLLEGTPVEPEDLSEGFPLVVATLPDRQRVADAHHDAGLVALGLPTSYPLGARKRRVGHDRCRPIGVAVAASGLRGVHCRSAASDDGSGRELAWFPSRPTSRATLVRRLAFHDWWNAAALP